MPQPQSLPLSREVFKKCGGTKNWFALANQKQRKTCVQDTRHGEMGDLRFDETSSTVLPEKTAVSGVPAICVYATISVKVTGSRRLSRTT